MRATLPRRLGNLVILIGWVSAVVVCTVKPLGICGPEGAGRSHHESESAIHDEHEHTSSDHSHDHDADREHEGPSSCDDSLSCGAIFSALTIAPEALVHAPALIVLYEMFSLGVILQDAAQNSETSILNERVLLLTHEVCTRTTAFSLAPPIA